MEQKGDLHSTDHETVLSKKRRGSDDGDVNEPNRKHKKLRPSSPDENGSGKTSETEATELEDFSEKLKGESLFVLPSLTKESNNVGEYLIDDKEDENESGNIDKEQTVSYERPIEPNFETTDSDTSLENDEIEKDEYVYRLLRFDELYSQGLLPKNIYSTITLEKHVHHGSKGNSSRFISCCETMNGLHRLIGLTNESSRVRDVVRINMTKLKDYEDVTIIKLTDEDVRGKHIERYSTAWGYAEKFEEVILAPKSHVPANCVERIGIVKDRSFTKDEHIVL